MAYVLTLKTCGRNLACLLVCLGMGYAGVVHAQSATQADLPKQNVETVYELIASTPFVYKKDEVEDYGRSALSLSGDARIYALWRVFYAYKIGQNKAKIEYWRNIVSARAQAENDSNLDLFARFMWQSFENEGKGFTLMTDREWATYLEAPDEAVQNIAMIERERHLQYFAQWADAIDLGHSLIVRLEAKGAPARAALIVAYQSMAYDLTRVGDFDGYAQNMYSAALLSKADSFFLQKMDMLYDLAYLAALRNDIAPAQRLQKLYAANVARHGISDFKPMDTELCAMVADKAGDFRSVISCLKNEPAMQGKIATEQDAFKLRLIVKAFARLGNEAQTKRYLNILDAVSSNFYAQDGHFEESLQPYLLAGAGRYHEAFDALDAWSEDSAKMAETRRIASVRNMYKALRKELDSKTEESRLLVKQVQMQRMLLGAAGVIALLLIVIVAGGAFWVMRMRRLHASLNEAHEHAEAANSAKSRFLAVMSHELRTPLNGVLGMAQALRKKDDLNPTQLEQVNILVDSGQTLLALLNDVLDMSRIEAGKVELAPSPASLKDTIERVINTYSSLVEAKGLVLRYDLDPSAAPVMLFDVLRVYQCLSNLVSNAVKFTEKGTVRILVSAEERRGGGYVVRCEVRDTGIGMTKAVMERLFEAYSQADAMTVRKYGGSGLGLNISRRLAELMGGALTVTSQEGVGSSFVMTFKSEAVAEEAPHAEAPSQTILAEEDENLPGMRILLVDDHPVNRKVARLFLEPFGFIITEAADGQEALDCDMSRFDLVLMDLNMPKMGGLEATRLFRAGEAPGRHVPIVALTADAMKDQVAGCYAAGMDAHIAKPIIMDTLIGTVTRLLHLQDGVEDGAEQDAEDAPQAVTAS